MSLPLENDEQMKTKNLCIYLSNRLTFSGISLFPVILIFVYFHIISNFISSAVGLPPCFSLCLAFVLLFISSMKLWRDTGGTSIRLLGKFVHPLLFISYPLKFF